ncbi:IS200/IS605 family transposon protein TnpB [Natronobacterium gregoryi]|uniref:IS200/IS605 family transposon protein TnpB n=2 Tax=Natronobacterium gregoryi TaxID=44930 RepID=L0AHW6_NATGS|nr:IS200/IS605 family transposon protein TnpB [Natronobacterium gregoryi]AFZ73401.1 transposase [Natronobacterium gregoryi SP2]ELY68597.1 transposase, IS605 OrfB family protein [Natronobacterium gregoryi SP2]PLK19678.1 IS200/IS605 family transposon protein TnpB [Natronobacterium gregoryi SP2]SFI72999.1 transposase [Natronobacterium gregoryi]
MQRTNTFEVRPLSVNDEELLLDVLDASAALWNEVNYERRQNFFNGESVWEVSDYRERYKDVLGSATAQQIIRKNKSAWKSFLSLNEKWKDGDLDEKPSPPGYWGNEDDGRELSTLIRNDMYSVEFGDRSRLEIPIGSKLKDEYDYGYYERLRLEVAGEPKWTGEQGRLELTYDETTDTFRAIQPVEVPDSARDSPLASEEAALDIGANNLVACTTTAGDQYVYEGRSLCERFRETTEEIAHCQSLLDDQRRTSKRIDRLYDKRTKRRNHAQDALVRDLVEQLYEDGVYQLYVGDLGDVLETHWVAEVNEKTHNFWAFGRFVQRLESVCEEYGIEVCEESEEWTTQQCPKCNERDNTHRNEDYSRCNECGFEGHADLAASRVFLEKETSESVGLMAQPVCFEWDDHEWSEVSYSPVRVSPKEAHTNQSTYVVGKLASVDSA